MSKDVIVSCDFTSKEELEKFLDKIEESNSRLCFKVGMELFYAGILQCFNPIKMIKKRGHKVFLDLKLIDEPKTASKAVKILVEAGADIITIHSDGGYEMMKYVANSINETYENYERKIEEYVKYEFEAPDDIPATERLIARLKEKINNKPMLLGVLPLKKDGNVILREDPTKIALLCKKAGLGGVVCPMEELINVRNTCGRDFITVVEDISLLDAGIKSPTYANVLGANFIVVGNPITKSALPKEAYKKFRHDFMTLTDDQEELEKARELKQTLQYNFFAKEK